MIGSVKATAVGGKIAWEQTAGFAGGLSNWGIAASNLWPLARIAQG
jgi:hypothetical protein